MSHAPTVSRDRDLYTSLYSTLTNRQKTELRKIWLHATATDSNAIGWLPTRAFDIRAERDHVVTVFRNGDNVGWAMAAPSVSRGVLKLYQIWVRPDARILEHGRSLVAELRGQARKAHCYQIEAWVAEDLPANIFWAAIGFTRCNWRWGKGEDPRKHWRWVAVSASVCNA